MKISRIKMILVGALLLAAVALTIALVIQRWNMPLPSDIYIPANTYQCTAGSDYTVCSGNAYDGNGEQWTVIDKAYYQVRSPTDTRRMIQMTLTNDTEVYILDGSGRGEDSPTPVNDPTFTFVVTSHPGLNARLRLDNINGVSTYVVSFYAQ